MNQRLDPKQAGQVVLDLIDTINANRAYLSEIDGAIGDGDHGINMSKGFSLCRDALLAQPELPGLAEALGHPGDDPARRHRRLDGAALRQLLHGLGRRLGGQRYAGCQAFR